MIKKKKSSLTKLSNKAPLVPSKQHTLIGPRAKRAKGADADFIEVSFEIAGCVDFQTARAKVGFRTSDPSLVPSHGSTPTHIREKLSEALNHCIQVADLTAFDALFGAIGAMIEKANERGN